MNQTAEKLPEVVKENNVVQVSSESPMKMYEIALSKGADIEQLERMLAFQEKYDAVQAKKAFVEAMALFKSKPINIVKDKTNSQYRSKYVSLGNLVNSVLPAMSECELSHRWDIDQSSGVTVTCIVTHSLGHSESTTMTAPPDKSGSKNPIQEIKSTITYLKAATFEGIMGLASTDANIDDDGNGAASVQYISEKQVSTITDMINAHYRNPKQFLDWLGVQSVEQIPANQYGRAMSALKGLEK